ncbi:MAG: putative two-component sensor histidine kinase [Firmicutes bacterium]|nr:putative two-component sensor histidine kinase [Bacillota bacterium]
MEEKAEKTVYSLKHVVHTINDALMTGKTTGEVLEAIVQCVYENVNCQHVFLSRYESANETFKAIAWRSIVTPSDVSLEQKFMGTAYLANQPVILKDLSQYNYRLRPSVARQGFLSLVGMPLMGKNGIIGVLEIFADEADCFSDFDIDLLTMYAKQAALTLENSDLVKECEYWAAEKEFLLEIIDMGQESIGTFLYKAGDTFSTVMGVDGVAVFGLDAAVAGSPLQEVLAKGFSMADIGRLKTLYTKEYLARLGHFDCANGQDLLKQSLKTPGASEAKFLYTVPVAYKQVLYGIIVFYWEQLPSDTNVTSLEALIKRMVENISRVMGSKYC